MKRREHAPAEVPGWQKLIAEDRGAVSPTLAFRNKVDYGLEDIRKDRYLSAEFHQREVEKLWKKVWQFACFEEDIPEVGDYTTYEIAGISIIVTRSAPERISAFYNSCLHRGALLAQGSGSTRKFVCPFHGWSFGLEGTVDYVTAQWDFPHVCAGKERIRPVLVETFKGMVFINMNLEAQSLHSFLDPLPEFLKQYPFQGRRQRVAWVRKIVPGNWKNAMEAFAEGYHLPVTHPQVAETLPGFECEYDIIGQHITRLTGAGTTPNCITGPDLTEQQVIDKATDAFGMPRMTLGPAQTARAAFADAHRAVHQAQSGLDLSQVSDTEVIDSQLFHVFPNSVIWGSYALPLVYRWRPNGQDHATAIFEVFRFAYLPEGAETPAPAPVHDLTLEQNFADAEELDFLGNILDQDCSNLILQHKGLLSSPERGLKYSRYQESIIRHFHRVLDRMLVAEDAH